MNIFYIFPIAIHFIYFQAKSPSNAGGNKTLQIISRVLRTRLTKPTVFCDKNLWKCICLCAVVSLLSFSGYIYLDGGVFVLRDDFNAQQIMFSTALNGALKQWSGEWCWNVDLGTQLIGGYSFYNLGSPFFWISLCCSKIICRRSV